MKNFIFKTGKGLICLLAIVYFNMSSAYASLVSQIGYIEVTPIEANHVINTYQNLIILDVRNPTDYENGHILGAISIPISELNTKYITLDKNFTILVYGKNNGNSEACKLLWKNGYKSLYSLAIDNEDLVKTTLNFIINNNTKTLSRRQNIKSSNSLGTKKSIISSNYCVSIGGSTKYEYIQNISTSILSEGVMSITVEIYIANPEGCVYGESCPSYDDSPEFINAWIDWNGNDMFEPDERVLNAALTGYSGMNYKGTMSTSTVVNIPENAKDLTWIRVNLGWDYDPNDPCEYSWEWGHVGDKEIIISNQPPAIEDIIISGIGVPDSNFPLTNDVSVTGEEKVKFDAKLKENDNYEITEINWSGKDIITGKGNPYECIAGSGTHGNKNVDCTVVYKHKANGSIGKVKKSKDFKLFFHKEGKDSGTENPPNWFRYWKKDKAVPDMESSTYDPTIPGYGRMTGFGVLKLGSIAAGQHYDPAIVLTGTALGTGLEKTEIFGGPKVTGIDCVAEVIAHENYHKWVNDQWGFFGSFFLRTDSDEDIKINKDDNLPDFYEKATSKTSITNTDTYNLDAKKSPQTHEYARYGDQEYMAMRTGNDKKGVKSGDWAYPGKQTETGSTKSAPLVIKSQTTNKTSYAKFTGNYTDEAKDNNSNGVYDILRVTAEIEVSDRGVFGILAKLNDGDTTEVTFITKQITLEEGIEILVFDFDGIDISESGIDGSYKVSFILINGYGDEIDNQAYTTANYKASDFKVKDVSFTNQYSITGNDLNYDNKFDSLTFNIGININVADNYKIEGGLYDKNGDAIEILTKNVFLEKSNHEVQLKFDGKKINSRKINGPYYLRYLGISKETLLDFRNDAHSTSGYKYTEFQSSKTTFDGQFNYNGIDTDGDNLYNYLRTNIGIYTELAGQFKISGALFDLQDNQITENEVQVDLTNGNNTIEFNFNGKTINAFGIDGPYKLKNLTLINGNGIMVDFLSVADTTLFFSSADFQKPDIRLVSLLGRYEDYKTDVDSNCTYNFLTVKAEVALGELGYVIAKAKLEDVNGNEICWAENIAKLSSDTIQYILLNFDGESIYKQGVNGPYSIKNFYIYHTGDPTVPDYVVNAHTTKPYNFNEFDTIPGMQIAKFETICSGDSLHIGDTIFTEPGQYTINLTDANGCDSTVVLTLSVNPVYNETAQATICQGDIYTFGKQTLTEAGKYTEVFESAFGCDSTVVLTLVVNPVFNETTHVNICQGETYTFGKQTLNKAGVYTEVFTSTFGCDSTVVLTLNIEFVEKPVLIANADTLSCNMEGEYSWYLNDKLIENVKTKNYTVETTGNYQLSIINKNGCHSPRSDSLFVTKTSTVDLEYIKNIIVYPNPTTGKVSIKGLKIQTETFMQLFNAAGKRIYAHSVAVPQTEIDMTDYAPGIYTLALSQGNMKVNIKIVKL